MKYVVDEWVLERVFHKHQPSYGDAIYWQELNEEAGGEGYIVLFSDGQHIHTYHYPPDTWS